MSAAAAVKVSGSMMLAGAFLIPKFWADWDLNQWHQAGDIPGTFQNCACFRHLTQIVRDIVHTTQNGLCTVSSKYSKGSAFAEIVVGRWIPDTNV